jgi:sensor histidine kinase regulating citrate/malate metabolism
MDENEINANLSNALKAGDKELVMLFGNLLLKRQEGMNLIQEEKNLLLSISAKQGDYIIRIQNSSII